MKKVFLIGALFALFFTSCKKDDGVGSLQIGGIEVPQSDAGNPALAGSSVTIKGDGFTEASEIWFRVATKSSSDVKATVTAVTKTEITFIVPDVVGSQSIVLKQAGKEQVLGEMSFAKEEIYAISHGESTFLNKYDSKTGEFVKQEGDYSVFDTYEIQIGIASNNVLYYVGYHDTGDDEGGVVKYDLKTNQVSFITKNTENRSISAIVMINNKLHGIALDKTTGYEVVEIADDGTETLVKKFGNIDIGDDVYFYNCTYDNETNSIFCVGDNLYLENDYDYRQYYYIASFSLESGIIKLSDQEIDGRELFLIESKLYSTQIDQSSAENTCTKSFVEINKTTLNKIAVVGTVEQIDDSELSTETMFGRYSESLNAVFLTTDICKYENNTDHSQAEIYDISTKTTKELKLEVDGYLEYFINRITE